MTASTHPTPTIPLSSRQPLLAHYDVLIAGAGPAGSAAAITLARAGRSVLLLDRSPFPRPKVCGCCLNPRALAALAQLRLAHLPAQFHAHQLDRFCLAVNGRTAHFRHPLGVALSRERLDLALLQAAQDAGATILTQASARLLPVLPDSPREPRSLLIQHEANRHAITAARVVDATGLGGRLDDPDHPARPVVAPHSKLGAGAIAPAIPHGYHPHSIYMACAPEGYVGLVALEDGRLDIAAALNPRAVPQAGGLAPLAARILSHAGLPPIPEISRLDWKGTPLLTRCAANLAAQSLFRVGDSAGYIEPFTGEGMAWALVGGARLGAILAQNPDDPPDRHHAQWIHAHRRIIRNRQSLCRLAAAILRRPQLANLLLITLNHAPALARPFLRHAHKP